MSTITTTHYGYSVRLPLPIEEAVVRVKGAFLAEGFGVLSEIDVRAKMQEKLAVEMESYVILGMCNPRLAHQALTMEPGIGLMLPCNVIVYEQDGETIVSAQQPKLMLSVTGNATLTDVAAEADTRILQALEELIGRGRE